MLVAGFINNHPTMGSTRTYQDFYKFLGDRPHRLGIVTKLYDDLTASYLTESLRNIVYRDAKSSDKYTSINSWCFEWEADTNLIKRIPFVEEPIGDGENASEITMTFGENYYQKNDIFKNDITMQQFLVVSTPVRKAENAWQVCVRIIDNDYKSTLDRSGCHIGDTTRFQSNAHPELHSEGFVKYQSSVEKHRGYITTHRVDDSYSAQYAAYEDTFIKIAKGDDNGNAKEVIYKMDKKEKTLLDNFMFVRNNGLNGGSFKILLIAGTLNCR